MLAIGAAASAYVFWATFLVQRGDQPARFAQSIEPGTTRSAGNDLPTYSTQRFIEPSPIDKSAADDPARTGPYANGLPNPMQLPASLPEELKSQLAANPLAIVADPWPLARMKFVIGPTATVLEQQSELLFQARVDTGARSCSMHVEKFVIRDEADEMEDNVGKEIRFKVVNHERASRWIESIIDCCTNVRTSDHVEQRYKVPIVFRWNSLERMVLVTLNNRADMNYPLLLGRNFLGHDFVVDVALDNDL